MEKYSRVRINKIKKLDLAEMPNSRAKMFQLVRELKALYSRSSGSCPFPVQSLSLSDDLPATTCWRHFVARLYPVLQRLRTAQSLLIAFPGLLIP